ncbi:cysteine biosynthesis protein CysZ [Pseudoroseomonas deserti]|uniref:Cysteine biosynthesis protein CysZ n=1 Tax=Teichococcus deserti TaxID=1817963 RepID=A0A1V2GZ69_9PROT|nr:EI24 domain-containing protein [Pseudoroseomonas deserti]ONG50652.1 cysteine biosynthesis protein CysZ [Pseudoroseomonas deserti]
MKAVPASLLLPLKQLDDPAFRRPLLKALGVAILAFGGLAWLADWGVGWLAGGTGWLATVAGLLGGLLVLVSTFWLFVPVMLGITGLFSDEVAEAVERRFYPALPPAQGASIAAQARAGLGLALRFLVISLALLPLALIAPPLGVVVYWVLAALSLGYGLFDGVAQRRMSVADSQALRRRHRAQILAIGGALAALAVVPVANLLVPVLGTAAMTHLLHRG